jgi:hypothetical protein
MPDALMIGIKPAGPGKGMGDDPAPEAGAGELAAEAFCKACDARDYGAAFDAFRDLLAAAKDSDSGGGGGAPPPRDGSAADDLPY